MRDFSLAAMFVLLVGLALRRPWLGLLGLVFVAVLHPQGYATGWLRGVPVYLVLGLLVAAATAVHFVRAGSYPRLYWDWRFGVGVVIGLHMVVTTILAINPWVAWPKLTDLAKIAPLLALVVVLIDTRERLFLLSVTIAASIAAVVLKGGYWAFMTGFSDRVYGPPGGEFADNNDFAVAVLMTIPLIVLWSRYAASQWLRRCLLLMVVLGFASALSSWSRGGMLGATVVGLLLVRHSRKPWLAASILAAAVVAVFVVLPEGWFARMQTLANPSAEGSAASRLEVWRLGWEYALQHPWFGGGFGSNIYVSLPTGGVIAWHSAYVSLAAEHGLVGLLLWLALLVGTVVDLSVVASRASRQGDNFLADQATMLRASLAGYAVGAAFLSIAYWEFLGLFLAGAVVTSRMLKQSAQKDLAPEAVVAVP